MRSDLLQFNLLNSNQFQPDLTKLMLALCHGTQIAAKGAFKQACDAAGAVVLEPVMTVQVTAPEEFQGVCVRYTHARARTYTPVEFQSVYVR